MKKKTNLNHLRETTKTLLRGEYKREKAEDIRVIAEEARQKAEEARRIAEEAREHAEKIRREIYKKLKVK